MKKLMMTALIALLATTAQAASTSHYVTTKRVKGKDLRGSYDVSYVQLIPRRGLSPRVMRKVNSALKKDALDMICERAENRAEAARQEVTVASTTTFVSAKVLSVKRSNDYYCGGAYPDAYATSANFDLRTGQTIDFEQEVKVPGLWNKLVQERLKKAIPSGEETAECADFYKEYAETGFPTGVPMIDARKITVDVSFAHAMRACEFSVEIPLEQLAPVAKPGSLLKELAEGAIWLSVAQPR